MGWILPLDDSMKWLLHNIWIKLLAVFMAFLLWFHVATEKEHEVNVRYRPIYEGLADSLILGTPPREEIVVRCRGTGKNLLPLLFRDRLWPIDLTDSTQGLAQIELFAYNAPRTDLEGVEFLFIVGLPRLWLDIDRIQHKTVPIVPAFVYEPREGYLRIGPEVIDPDSVVVTGPARVVRDILRIQSRPRTFSDLANPIDTKVELAPLTTFNITRNIDECRLYADVQEYAQKTFAGVPVPAFLNETGDTLHIEPKVVSVLIGGGRQALANLDSTLIRVYLDSTLIDTTVIDTLLTLVRLSASIPPEVRLLGIEPDSVIIRRP